MQSLVRLYKSASTSDIWRVLEWGHPAWDEVHVRGGFCDPRTATGHVPGMIIYQS